MQTIQTIPPKAHWQKKSQEQSAKLNDGIEALERLAYRIETMLSRKPWVSVFILSAVFLVFAFAKARRAMFWFDEILTLYVSSLPNVSTIWKALAADADANPLGFHLITRLSGNIFGWTTFGLRAPSMLGYLTMMLCVYLIVRRYAGALYAIVASLAGFLTYAPFYSTDARPYAMVLGLSSIALVCWQQASSRYRTYALLGLFLSLGVALTLHYYALLSFTAIGVGEPVRSWRNRRMDWPVWCALLFAAAPLFFFLPLMRANRVLAHAGNAPTTLSPSIGKTALFYFPHNGFVFAAFVLVVAGVWVLLLGRRVENPFPRYQGPPVHELAAWVVMLLAPLEAFVLGRLVTGVYQARYGIVTVIGFSILMPLGMRRLFGASRVGALLALLFLILCFGAWYRYSYQTERYVEGFTTTLTPWLRTANVARLPIVIADPIVYLPMAQSAPDDLRDLLVYTPDAKEAASYEARSSGDYCLAGLRGITPLNLPTFSDFTRSHQKFLLLCRQHHLEETDWIAPKLRDSGARFRLYSSLGPNALVLVDFPAKDLQVGNHPSKLYADWACMPDQ